MSAMSSEARATFEKEFEEDSGIEDFDAATEVDTDEEECEDPDILFEELNYSSSEEVVGSDWEP